MGDFLGALICRMASLLCVVRQAHHEGDGWVHEAEFRQQFAIVLATPHFPHGELVEPRTAALPSRQSAASPPTNLQTKIIVAIYPRLQNLSYPIPVLSMGSCFRSRSKVGKDGVSAGGQRTQALADLFVFGGQSAHFRQILPLLLTPTPIVRTLHRRRRWARTQVFIHSPRGTSRSWPAGRKR